MHAVAPIPIFVLHPPQHMQSHIPHTGSWVEQYVFLFISPVNISPSPQAEKSGPGQTSTMGIMTRLKALTILRDVLTGFESYQPNKGETNPCFVPGEL